MATPAKKAGVPTTLAPQVTVPSQHDTDSPVILRHDSEFSVGSNYDGNNSPNDLTVMQGSILLIADTLGTGLLALPANIHVIGFGVGLVFLIMTLPINYYAGCIFHETAMHIEGKQKQANRAYESTVGGHGQENEVTASHEEYKQNTGLEVANGDVKESSYQASTPGSNGTSLTFEIGEPGHSRLHHDTATKDYIGMTQALFQDKRATVFVMILYYTNIFLVLGNYILVMSHAVVAMVGEEHLCIPAAGLLASTVMFGVSQLRTMANLGRTVSIVSLAALFVVVIQCLLGVDRSLEAEVTATEVVSSSEWVVLRQLSAFGSIGFATGSQKLFLNIRHELADRSTGPQVLGRALVVFGTFYVGMVLAAGPNPPAFLFDAIPYGWSRHLGGFLLWIHVVVSYAINSQAICSSMDRLVWHRLNLPFQNSPEKRWLALTALMALTAYTVANAVPFFKDLLAFIGAVTAVPLTLLLPAIYFRKYLSVPLWIPTWESKYSIALTYYAIAFMVLATTGSLYSIQRDWSTHGPPFSCS